MNVLEALETLELNKSLGLSREREGWGRTLASEATLRREAKTILRTRSSLQSSFMFSCDKM